MPTQPTTAAFRTALSLMAALGLLAAGIGHMPARAQRAAGAGPEPRCTVSPVDAIRIALKRVPRRALQANIEYDEARWVDGVTIVSGKVLKEVTLDPMTGAVGDIETLTPGGEAKEIEDQLTNALGQASSRPGKPSAKR